MNHETRIPARISAGAALLIGALLIATASGCSRLSDSYGRSEGITGRTSLNGFGALRASFEQAGFRTRDINRLSERVARTDTIVWTPQVLNSIDSDVTRWFDRWLRQGGRTLIYVVPDSGSAAAYWQDAAKLADPNQRLEYRRRAAREVNRRIAWRLNRSEVPSNGWFTVKPLKQVVEIETMGGDWTALSDPGDQEQTLVTAEFTVGHQKRDELEAQRSKAANQFSTTSGPTGPNAPSWYQIQGNGLSKDATRLRRALVGNPEHEIESLLIGSVTSKKWKGSKILVVSGGSLLTNYAFTRSWNRRLAAKLIAESTPGGDQTESEEGKLAGFMTSGASPIPVSEREPGVPKATGMELLTVWPVSLITIHGVLLCLIICLMLFPIFGRPKRIQRASQSHFGDHLDAVASLMKQAGGEEYARHRISEYMKRMRGESHGKWVLPDAKPPEIKAVPTKQSQPQPTSPTEPSP